jgi:tetratricopeptide (TPR) repeat protein
MLFLAVLFSSIAYSATAQVAPNSADQFPAPGLRKLSGDDEKRAKELEAQLDSALKADRWDEAIAKAEELLALRARVQGPKHFDTISADWRLKALRRVAPMPKEDRAAYESTITMSEQALALNAQGKYSQAQPLFEKALGVRRRVLSDDHPDTAVSYNILAYTLYVQEKYAQAQPLLEKALEIRRRLLSEDHPDTATSYNNVASSLNAQGKYAAAQPHFEKALDIRRRLLTDNHTETAQSYNSVAYNLNAQGNYAQAQPLFEKALEIRRRLLTDDHLDTAESYNSLAKNLNALAKYTAAQPLFEKALEIRRRLLTDDHSETAQSYNNLAYNLYALGKHAQAQPLYEKSLAIRRRLLTDDHADTANSYNNLALNLIAQGKYAEAQPLSEKALAINRRLLGDDHPDTAGSYNNLAGNLNAQGKRGAAQPLYEQALAIHRRLLTDDHPHTARSYHNLAATLHAQGKYAEAQPLYEKALAINRRLLSDDHPDTANCYNMLALNLIAQGKAAQAQPLSEKALAICRRVFTDYHPKTAYAYNTLALNFNAKGKYAEAQPLFEKALAIWRRLLTDDHPDTALGYNNLAVNLSSQGKHADAQPLFEKALAIRRRLLTDDHPHTASGYYNLASNLNAQGKYVAAQPLYEKSLEIHRRLLTDDHPHTALTYNNMAANLNAQGKYAEAKGRWTSAVKTLDAARLCAAFTGLERAAALWSACPALAAVLARLGEPSEAWQVLEEDFGRGLLDELAARQDKRLTPDERTRIRELTAELERLDKLAEATPKNLEQAERAKQFEELKRQREVASVGLGEFQTKLAVKYGAMAGRMAGLEEIQAALPANAALVAWVDIPPVGPNAADPDGEHWGVVVRSRGIPVWIPITGTGPNGLWTKDDTALASRVKSEFQTRQGAESADVQRLLARLRAQRLDPLVKALSATADGLPMARKLIVLPSRAMAGIPIEALLGDDATHRNEQAPSATTLARRASEGATTEQPTWIVSYAPSGTVFQYLRARVRPDRHAGLLALGDPVFERHDKSSDPRPAPDHGLLLNVVVRGSNAANHGLRDGDVLLAYNGRALSKKDDLKIVNEGDKPIPIEIWRDGALSRRELAPDKLGVVIDLRPAREAIAEQRKLQKVLAEARSGGEDFSPLPGTRREVEAIARLFGSDDRPVKALLGSDASEPQLDRIATSGELGQFGFIHLATHGVIDEGIPQRSAVILTQTGLPDPLEQVMNHKPVFDGRLSVREIQRTWDLKAELVTLSACETALGKESGGEGFVGFTQALLMSGARSVCLSLWKVDDKATALLMTRFYQNVLGKRSDLAKAMPKAEALQEAKRWLRNLTVEQIEGELAGLERGEVRPLAREKGAPARKEALPPKSSSIKPYDHPYYWAAFVLVGDPD